MTDNPSPPRLFINYRHDDAGWSASLLYRELNDRLESGQVFLDNDRIKGAEVWPERLREELDQATVVVCLIGDRWLRAQDPDSGQRRLDQEEDWVRREIERAFERGVTVLPLLVESAQMPKDAMFPPSIRALCKREFLTLRRKDLQPDMEAITGLLCGSHGFSKRTAPRSAEHSRADVLALYRSYLQRRHRELVRFGGDEGPSLQEAYVDVALHREARRGKVLEDGAEETPAGLPGGRTGLRALLDHAMEDPKLPVHWVLRGEPGAGKSTAVRHLCQTLASEPDAPVPVYLSLARWMREDADVFTLVERSVAAEAGEAAATGLAAHLRASGQIEQRGALWLLLDGYDEVSDGGELRKRILALADEVPGAVIVVTTRPIGERELDTSFGTVTMSGLTDAQQRELLEPWLGADKAGEVLEQLAERPLLHELCGNPLMLTMLARLARRSQVALPRTRIELYDGLVDLLLTERSRVGGDPDRKEQMAAPTDARRLLGELSLRLQQGEGGESWTRSELVEELWKVNRADPDKRVVELWRSPDAFLDELAQRTGLLGEYDGSGEGWRYLHRSIREFLVAETLARVETSDQWLERAEKLDEDGLARWAESYALLCGLIDDPAALVSALGERKSELALRILPEAEIPFDQSVPMLVALDAWDGDHLVRLTRAARRAGWTPEWIEDVLWKLVTPDRFRDSIDELGGVHWALERIGQRPDRSRFFDACGKPLGAVPEIEFRPIPAGSFRMGSPENEAERLLWEGPQHPVAVQAFELAATPLTAADYAAFDARHRQRGGEADHPEIDVSWWAAYLCCAWLGARLPSEAEWEWACRAESPSAYWSGDTEEDLARVGWYGRNSQGRLHVVGEKPANPWGLYDMHGNVWEWCEDTWHDSYEGAPDDGSAWVEEGPGLRVFRGGSWGFTAGFARSAYRYGNGPGSRFNGVGFRPARPVTP